MRVLLMPDKFKGSLSAKELCRIMKEEIEGANSFVKCTVRPMADGGDGTLEILKEALPMDLLSLEVVDPLMRPIDAYYYYDDQTAYIELAVASGHALLSNSERNPMKTTTYGTGLLIRHAIAYGMNKIYLFLGGSSTNDAGIGILHALGVDFYDETDHLCPPNGASLSKIKRIDTSNMIDISRVQFTIVTDVKNLMYGPQGAAYVYAKQKGASEAEIRILDQGLTDFSQLIKKDRNIDISSLEGGGAAGGIAAGLSAFLNPRIRSGFDELSRILGLEPLVEHCDMIITGEGRLDDQTSSGKLISGVCDLAKKYNKPVYAFVGQNTMQIVNQAQLGISKIYALCDIAPSVEKAIEEPETYLRALLHTFVAESISNQNFKG